MRMSVMIGRVGVGDTFEVVEHPFIYEINTWVWLDELSASSRRDDRPRERAGGRVGRDRGARVRRGLADGRVGAQPGRDRDRAAERRARRELPRGAAGRHGRRRRRLAVLHPRLHGRRAPRRCRTGSRSAREALARARAGADPRLRAEPRRARPPVDGGAPGVLRPGRRGRPRARPRVVRARRRPRARERPRPVLPGVARRRAAERVLARPARGGGRDARRGSPTSATASAATWRC